MFINSRLGCGTRGSEYPAAPATITITPPVLPLCFANALLTLYAVVVVVVTIVVPHPHPHYHPHPHPHPHRDVQVNSPGEDCKLHLLPFCLAAGSLTLFMSVGNNFISPTESLDDVGLLVQVLAIIAGCTVKEAIADGR